MQSYLKEHESHTCLLVVHLSFPCWFNRELSIIEKRKKKTLNHSDTQYLGRDSGKYVLKKEELLKYIIIWIYVFIFFFSMFYQRTVVWMCGFSHKILPKSLVCNIKLFWGFINFFRNVIRIIYKWKKWRENII